MGITIDYEVKYISPSHVSFVISQYESRFSSYHCEFYYNIDLGSGKVITLKDWFGPSYQQIVADSIEESIGQSVTTVATGGNAPRILRYCKRPIQYDADLIMTGLYLLYQKNAKKYRKA